MSWRTAILWTIGCGVLAAMLSAWLGPRTATAADPRAARWNAMTAPRRAAIVAQFQSLATERNVRNLETQAEELRSLSPDERDRLKWLIAQVDQAVSKLPPKQRGPLRELPQAAQAVQLYHIFEGADPDMLDRLAREWKERS